MWNRHEFIQHYIPITEFQICYFFNINWYLIWFFQIWNLYMSIIIFENIIFIYFSFLNNNIIYKY